MRILFYLFERSSSAPASLYTFTYTRQAGEPPKFERQKEKRETLKTPPCKGVVHRSRRTYGWYIQVYVCMFELSLSLSLSLSTYIRMYMYTHTCMNTNLRTTPAPWQRPHSLNSARLSSAPSLAVYGTAHTINTSLISTTSSHKNR